MIDATAMGSITNYLSRLKQGAGSRTLEGQLGESGVGRFAALMQDPMLQLGNMQGLMGMDSSSGSGLTSSDRAIMGGINLMNTKALATLSKVMENEQSPLSGMYRDLLQGVGAASPGGAESLARAMELARTMPSAGVNAQNGENAGQASEGAESLSGPSAMHGTNKAHAAYPASTTGDSARAHFAAGEAGSAHDSVASDAANTYAQALQGAHQLLTQQIFRAAGGPQSDGAYDPAPSSHFPQAAGLPGMTAAQRAYGAAQQMVVQQGERNVQPASAVAAQSAAPAGGIAARADGSGALPGSVAGGRMGGFAATPEAAERAQLHGYRPGALAALFESGSRGGSSAIGYDRVGGTSYGKYQLASRVGTMDGFLTFLDRTAPDIASRLRAAGTANTGSRSGAMPSAWKAVARDNPARFEKLQDEFIHNSNYTPAYNAVTKAMGVKELHPAMQEVLFSTAVQHGPTGAVKIFARAFGQSGSLDGEGEDFIKNVYAIRAGQFGSSTTDVRRAVHGRLAQELRAALGLLENSSLV